MMHQCCISDVFYCFPDLADVFHFSPRYHFNNKIRLLTAQLVLLNVLFRAKSSSVSLTTPSSFSCFASEYFPIWHRSRRIKHFRRRCQTIPQQTIGWRNHGVRFLMPTLSIEKSCTALKSTLRSETKKIWSHLNLDKDDKNHAANDNYQQVDDCNDLKSIDGFTLVVQKAIQTLVESDVRRGEFAGNTHGSSSQGRWLYDPVAKELEDILDQIVVKPRQLHKNPIDYGNQCKWLRWMKSTPSPLFLDLTPYIHHMVTSNHINYYNNQNDKLENAWISSAHLQFIDMSLDQYLSRIACHLILLPSGSETGPLSLIESTGAHIYGKLLYGGVTRYRILKSDGGKKIRRAGERREVMKQSSASATSLDSAQSYCHPSWVQLGGTARKYDALDIGPAAVLELTLLPRLWQDLPTVFDESVLMKESSGDMTLSNAALGWDPSIMLGILPKGRVDLTDENRSSYQSHANNAPENMYKTLAGKQRNDALKTHFQSRIGGLQPQINAIVRRVLDGRNVYSASNIDFDDGDDSMTKTKLEARELATLGIQPVRGLLLYGKSGTGKTLLAREISRVLSSRPPKIVSASELLDRWVGGSERCVRDLFEDAEEELRLCRSEDDEGLEFLNSALHVIVIDEIDAVFRKRIDAEDAGSRTRNSVVNQLLAKLDGVRALPNILMIGMTNRVELLDEALLRPGRFEVQVEVSLPDKDGRREILHIHFGPLRKNGRLSTPLCRAIDGIPMNGVAPVNADDDKQSGLLRSQLKSFTKQMFRPFLASMSIRAVDLADDEFTGGFSGADIAGLVRNAGSIALERARADGRGVEGLLVTLEDVECALKEMKS